MTDLTPKLEWRHMRTHVVVEGAPFTVYERQQLIEISNSQVSWRNGQQYWKTIEHVIDDGRDSYLGGEIKIPRERVAFRVEIRADEFDSARRRTEDT